jgi:hypothetical protein
MSTPRIPSTDFLHHPTYTQLCDLLRGKIEFPEREIFQGALAADSAEKIVQFAAQLHGAFPAEPLAHLLHAFALELSGKAMSAAAELGACCDRFPEFWEASLIRRRDWLWVANPLKLPPFDPSEPSLHPAINAMLTSSIIFLTRDGCMPRAVRFLKDAHGEFDPWLLRDARIEFTTLISAVDDPQIIAVMGRIHDNPSSPYDFEDVDAPFRPHPDERRITFEFFVRQETVPFVIVDPEGRVMHTREVHVSPRMALAHAELERMFEKEPGREVSGNEFSQAARQHQAQVHPASVRY